MSFFGLKTGNTIEDVIEGAAPKDKDYVIEQRTNGIKNFGVNDSGGRYAFMFEFDDNYRIIKVRFFSID